MADKKNSYIVMPERRMWFLAEGESAVDVSDNNPLCKKMKEENASYVIIPIPVEADEKPYIACPGEYANDAERNRALTMLRLGRYYNHSSSGNVIMAIAFMLSVANEEESDG